MAARKKASRKKTSRKKATRRKAGLGGGLGAALERLDLPPTFQDYARQVRARLDRLERELARASVDVRRRAARLLREASHQLGRLGQVVQLQRVGFEVEQELPLLVGPVLVPPVPGHDPQRRLVADLADGQVADRLGPTRGHVEQRSREPAR